MLIFGVFFVFASRRRHTIYGRDWSSDVCSSDLSSIKAMLDPRMVAASTQGAAPGVQADFALADLITPASHGCWIIPAITYSVSLRLPTALAVCRKHRSWRTRGHRTKDEFFSRSLVLGPTMPAANGLDAPRPRVGEGGPSRGLGARRRGGPGATPRSGTVLSTPSSGGGLDVLVESEEVGRVVLALQGRQPLVVSAVGVPHHLLSLLQKAWEVQV